MSSRILVTGAGGYVGQRLAERLLDRGDATVVAYVHGKPGEPPPTPPPALARFGDRVIMAAGELGTDGAFSAVDPGAITHIVHGAAVTRFNVEAELADRVNLGGARQAFEFATKCPRLEHLVQVSTLYAAGLREGEVVEQPLDRAPKFANHYERSKWEAEDVLRREYAQLPATIARVATVIADNERGAVTQRNAVHNTLRLLFHGLLSLVPGVATTPVYLVTGDLVVDALAALVQGQRRPPIVHVSYDETETGTLGDLLDLAYEVFERDENYRSRRLLRPLLVDAESFEMLVSSIDGFGGDAVRQALISVAPFARQLFSTKRVRNDELRRLLPSYQAPPPAELIRRTVEHLVATRWGRVAA